MYSSELRARAFEEADAVGGVIVVGEEESEPIPFEWIGDADPRLGPILEAVINGKYYWVPFSCIRQMSFEKPADLRDMVWTPVFFTWANGGESPGFVPTRYVGTEERGDAAARLARSTDWDADNLGMGQRMLTTDEGDYALLEIREVRIGGDDGEDSESNGV